LALDLSACISHLQPDWILTMNHTSPTLNWLVERITSGLLLLLLLLLLVVSSARLTQRQPLSNHWCWHLVKCTHAMQLNVQNLLG
jgi:hypothetical protein